MMITEALAEIKTLQKRIAKKRETVKVYLARQDGIRDPLEKDGGSPQFITRELQAVTDLEERLVALRRGIQTANATTMIAILGHSHTINDWLVWRREVAPELRKFLQEMRATLSNIREQAKRQGHAVVSATASAGGEVKPTDFIVNVSEMSLSAQAEEMEDILGQLDGQLSMKNATTPIAD